MSNYEGVIKDFKNFLNYFKYEENPTEENVTHFLLYLEKNEVTFSYILKVKAAISLYEQMKNMKETVFTPNVCRMLDGVKNLAVNRKPPVKKAPKLQLDSLKKMTEKVIIPFASKPERAKAIDVRTVFRAMVMYFTFCRFNCFNSLQADSFSDEGDSIEVFFPRAKNDTKHEGNRTRMMQNNTSFCPVFITRFYFKKFGFKFNGDHRLVNCRLRKIENQWMPQEGKTLSQTTANQQLRKLLTQVGVEDKRITHKSIKMAGVTAMLNTGASMLDVANQGRWRTVDIVQTYKHNSDEYKKYTAAQIPF